MKLKMKLKSLFYYYFFVTRILFYYKIDNNSIKVTVGRQIIVWYFSTISKLLGIYLHSII